MSIDLPEHEPSDPETAVRHEIRLRRAGIMPVKGDPFFDLSLLDLYDLLVLPPDCPPTALTESVAGYGTRSSPNTSYGVTATSLDDIGTISALGWSMT